MAHIGETLLTIKTPTLPGFVTWAHASCQDVEEAASSARAVTSCVRVGFVL